jgi:ribosomal protein S18 acetylase RimI-like enzyme
MAAAPVRPAALKLADLREFNSADLAAILDEQQHCWTYRFLWDFSSSRTIIERFVDSRNLFGYVLLHAGRPVGYSYYIHEDRKALIGDLYILDAFRDEVGEYELLHRVARAAAICPGVRRIEGQLLTVSSFPREISIYGQPLAMLPRRFMVLRRWNGFSRQPAPSRALYRTWHDRDLDAGAETISRSYQGHVDSSINDQYRSYMGARRFLHNTIQHPGCGVFYRPAGVVAVRAVTEGLCGICLGSLVLPHIGHITQLCVDPQARGHGVGYELLRRSIEAFQRGGIEAVSLTVTSSNRGATSLYESVGFTTGHIFPAFVWEAA